MKFSKDKKRSKIPKIFFWIIASILSLASGILLMFLVMKLLMGTIQDIKPFW